MWLRVLVVGAIVQLVAGCAPPRPPLLALPREVTLNIAVSDQVAKTDNGNVAAMVEVIEADLKDAGYFTQLVTAHPAEAPPLPRVEIQVRTASSADRERMGSAQLVSWAVTPVGGVLAIGANGSIMVDTFFVAEGRKPTYVGRTESSSIMAMTEDAQTAAGERAGHAIARDLLRTR